jgi:hypothetical protein
VFVTRDALLDEDGTMPLKLSPRATRLVDVIGGLPFTFDATLPPGTTLTPVKLLADDRMESSGWLYEPPGPRGCTVVALAHPRAEFARHYTIPGMLRGGYAVFAQNCRYLNNDTEMLYERLLLDVAAAMRWLRAQRFERIVLHGNCGGGALFATYQEQAALDPGSRWRDSAGGGRVDLGGEMPLGDALVVSAAHAGEGRFLLQSIDPSVTDESDPLSCDPTLDMFNPDNGYELATRTARYSVEFLARYRAAQRARVERLDRTARDVIAAERAARDRVRSGALTRPYDLLRGSREAIPHRLMTIHRTVANPATLDMTIDPSQRPVGSIFGILEGRPEFGNWFNLNIARVLAPRAWLSVWSGVSSRVDFLRSAAAITVPTLFITAGGDTDIFPAESESMWRSIVTPDRTRHEIDAADHYLRPLPTRGAVTPRQELDDVIVSWLERRFPR